ncbi:proline dehydrogenase family protein [Horticoccus luteus]|uniref:L-glutamate gamma-semialdehyde dehydrogenase n=1 Tax=Horticoccus luteus TaxID=2862869 RepID=A0A8F9TX38_9BACT|nr:proline dehydrogenase family protein [Horticoccus luteus]QYM79444.1 proline dehydrogenase family protein [Horticoccus luteus]
MLSTTNWSSVIKPYPMASARFPAPDPQIEAAVRAKGAELFALMEKQPPPALFSKKGAYARLMDWSMKDPAFKTQLFRFVDVLPSLHSSAEIVRHLQEYLGEKAVELNPALKVGLAASSFAPSLVAGPVKAQIVDMARQFVAGETGEDLIKQIQKNEKLGLATTIDLLGETVVSDEEADIFLRRNLEILDSVSKYYAARPTPCRSDVGPTGPLPRLNLSVKISALTPDVHPADPENSIEALKLRLRPILRRAAAVGALINFDMESYRLKDLTLALFKSIFEEAEFARQPAIGIALQAYLRDCEEDLNGLVAWARARGRPLNIRLVKGAYWDYETINAQQREWPIPVWQKKPESDANYEKLSIILLENADLITPNFASHNVRSCAHAIVQSERLGVDPRLIEFQALYGMADDLKAALLQLGHRVREYTAIGELLPGMAYLVRRLLENTSNEGFLRSKYSGETSQSQMLDNPVNAIAGAAEPLRRRPRPPGSFINAANTDFTIATNRTAQKAALKDFETRHLGKRWPCIVNGKKITNRAFIASVNPARPAQIIGYWAQGTVQDADEAVAASVAFFPQWRATPVDVRASILETAAEIMETRRLEINSLLILEAAKPWLEADGDTSEAIDFLRFYASEIRRIVTPVVTQDVPGEHCVQTWSPRGVGIAVAPWNFPLAILTGLTVAPLVAGNCVIIKPARQTSIIGAYLMNILREAGVPAGALHFLPCSGADAGAHLVAHPQVDFIAFTGSREVGLNIWQEAGKTKAGQINLKKVVCEMGGKNAMIIDTDADLDEAIPAVIYSAFGFAGQKCSALSRLIVLETIYDRFVGRLLSACPAIPVGDPSQPGTIVNPVIDEGAQKSILAYIEAGRQECHLAWQGTLPPHLRETGGYYVPPCIFTNCRPTDRIVREEIFGPVLAILKAKDLDEAFEMANANDYALTGGFFSRSPAAIDRAKTEQLVGNLYINRGCTGAVVQRHPFGGFKMSGGGTKAGGREYLENFLFPRLIAENVLRRGFTPVEAQPARQSD